MQIKVFTSRSCGPCATYKQNLEGLDGVEYIDVDDPANISEAISYGVMQVPTTVFENGEVWTGVRARGDVEAVLGL
jgi:glutaredoxin